MLGRALTVGDLKIDVSLNGGIDIRMEQVAPVIVTCVMDGAKIAKIYADEGVEFLSAGGFVGFEYKPGYDITELCDRRDLEKQLKALDEENEAMQAHNKGE